MMKDRFRKVLSFLHLADNSGEAASSDKLFKIRPFIQAISANFKTLFYPGKQLSLDEGTCPFKGRWNGVTYNANKPHKWGMKLYQLCDAVTGYCCKFRIGAEESIATRSVVLDLVHDYLFASHEVYTDRYYTSIPLFQDLFAQRTVAVGTIMGNRRGLPKDLKKKKLGKGEVAARRNGALLVLKWRDRRDVLVLSTKHTPAMQDVLVRVPGGRVAKSKPIAVQEYNDYMPRVDKSDQLLRYYSMNRKAVKWWKKLFFHLLQLSLVNAQKLYNIHRENQNLNPLPLLSFTIQLCESLSGVDKLTNIPTSNTLPLQISIDAKNLIPPDLNYSVIVLCVHTNLNIPSKNLKKKNKKNRV